MIYRKNTTKEQVVKMVKAGELTLAGCNGKTSKDKTYGEIWGKSLETGRKCSGATYLKNKAVENPEDSNQVFFKDELEALAAGYRPCSFCFPSLQKEWNAAPDKEVWRKNRIAQLKKQ